MTIFFSGGRACLCPVPFQLPCCAPSPVTLANCVSYDSKWFLLPRQFRLFLVYCILISRSNMKFIFYLWGQLKKVTSRLESPWIFFLQHMINVRMYYVYLGSMHCVLNMYVCMQCKIIVIRRVRSVTIESNKATH